MNQYFVFSENKIKQKHGIVWMQVAKHSYVRRTTEINNTNSLVNQLRNFQNDDE